MVQINQNLPILTGLRFFAAFHVVIFHNLYLFGDSIKLLPPWIVHFITKGESAVSFFFILSGFIMAHAYKGRIQTKKQRKEYLLSRFSKLYPLYLVGLVFDFSRVWNYFFAHYDFKRALIKLLISAFAYLTMLQSWVPNLTPVWNSPAWSLSCEFFFYFVFIYIFDKIYLTQNKFKLILIFYFIPILIFSILKLSGVDLTTPFFYTFWRSFPLLRLTEFLIGISIFSLLDNNSILKLHLRKFSSLYFWGSLIISLIIATQPIDKNFKIFTQLFMIPLFSTLIASATFEGILFQSIFSNKVMIYLGGASYALYILHQPLKNYFTESQTLLSGFTYFIGIVLLSCLFYDFFEKPMQKWIKQRFNS